MPEPLYPFKSLEPKWQKYWQAHKTFKTPYPSSQKKLYVLDMFPYPSGSGLHVGHPEGYTATDIYSRFKRMQGFNVLHPMGWDAFGLPAEQYAIETGTHPAVTTQKNIQTFKRQIQRLGLSYDWDREVDTTDPEYVRWTQWIFLQLYKKDLAYLAEVPVWWCEALGCVLANEEVTDGKSERGAHPVVRRPMRQWMLRITAYADRLLEDLALVNWTDSIKEMQKNWIGRSEGVEVIFKVASGPRPDEIKVFTTRPDTLFGVTYMVLSPEHRLVSKITTFEHKKSVEEYQKQAISKSELERTELSKEKSGVFTGAYAVNPVNREKIPIWIADYVLASYGTGAIMAVPAHDERDFEFAKKFNLSVVEVVQSVGAGFVPAQGRPQGADLHEAFTGEGVNINSGLITGLPTAEAKKKITDWIQKEKLGKSTVNYKLRDWLFSRQRYWGEPIPIVHCTKCGMVTVPENELPLRLPEMKDFKPVTNAPATERGGSVPKARSVDGSAALSGGEPPLAKAADWVNIKCPKCHGAAKRETNTMPQWAGSCWYYLRYIDPKNGSVFCDRAKEKYFMPVDLYVGGAEHAVLHLLYSRFWHKVLFDLGYVSTKEPFTKLVNQGMILGEDGQKMSKSRGNVINPDFVVENYGADSLRLYEMFMGPLTQMKSWSMNGVEGVYRFLGRIWRLYVDRDGNCDLAIVDQKPNENIQKLLHRTVKKVTEDIDTLQFNTAISALMIFSNDLAKETVKSRTVMENLLLLLAPFAPHLAEELWARMGHKEALAYHPWPAFDSQYLQDDVIEIPIMINGKIKSRINIPAGQSEAEVEMAVMKDEKVLVALAGKKITQKKYVPKKIYTIAVS
ncbi:MAG: leucine--tRNA ligase [Candidatus Omnitrophica bacterium CG1_02_49_16]|nr:MAG: leucine--tRNA ligase [Candidatus Omnitrophica bacterium CG1_02_49_16]